MIRIISCYIFSILLLSVSSFEASALQLTGTLNHINEPATKVQLAKNGKALFPIVIAPNASEQIEASANELASYLKKMSGAAFIVQRGDGKQGIAFGTINDFPGIPFQPQFDVNDIGQAQGFEIKSHEKGVYILGATLQSADYAMFDFLTRLGYRRFFPMKNWEVIPSVKDISFASHIRETPDFYTRKIWSGWGYWPKSTDRQTYLDWGRVSRNGGYNLRGGHIYGKMILDNKAEFDKHPEYYPLINGKRVTEVNETAYSVKLCISNPGLRKLIGDYAVREIEKNPSLEGISVEPSDGGGWCECDECRKLGNPSTCAVLLANTVAEAVRKHFAGKRHGMNAYNEHSPAPAIDVDPEVVVTVATSFIKGGRNVDDVIASWSEKKAVLGIREYYDVTPWSFFLPGKSKGSNINYLKTTIPKFHKAGARFMNAEASDDWGSGGLGYYLADKMLWDIREAQHIDELITDFLTKCFGPAAAEMRVFYTLIDGSKPKPLSADLVGRMYRALDKSKKKAAGNTAILNRLNDLTLYTRYCEMYLAYERSPAESKKKAFDELMTYVSTIRDCRMIHTWGDLGWFERKKQTLAGDWEAQKQWTWAQPQLDKLVSDGIKANKLLDFEAVDFSENLTNAPALLKNKLAQETIAPRSGVTSYYTWLDDNLSSISFNIKSTRGAGVKTDVLKIKLYNIGGASTDGTRETLVEQKDNIPQDGEAHQVVFKPGQRGLYQIVISDGNGQTGIQWNDKMPLAFKPEGINAKNMPNGTYYFYVPKNTKTIGFYANLDKGELVDPNGRAVMTFSKVADYRNVPVQKGLDGKLWMFRQTVGEVRLMTVPPYVTSNGSSILLPEEVVAKDNLK